MKFIFALRGYKKNNKIALVCSILFIVLLSSCAAMYNPSIWIGSKKLYEGPEKPANETAALIVYRDGTSLISVDGQDASYVLGRGVKMDILPGPHELAVSFHISSNVVDGGKVTNTTLSSNTIYKLSFNAQSGHIYRVVSYVDDTPENNNAAPGEGKTWSAYIYDVTEVGYPTHFVEMFGERANGMLVTKSSN
ncbi:MAG: hypothetical protein JXA04_00450 [Gammaproteobacteria bacterium]|nr:hypothetical protein [Gammaproteobacteria bacterium]